MDAKTDMILEALAESAAQVELAENDLAARRADLDAQIVRARQTGATVATIMETARITRATVYKSLNRAGLTAGES